MPRFDTSESFEQIGGVTEHYTVRHNLNATTAPATTDNASFGYAPGSVWVDTTNAQAYICALVSGDSAIWLLTTIYHPSSSTDNAIVRWDGTGGDDIQDSGILVDDSNNMLFPTTSELRFRDADINIYSNADGEMTIEADSVVNITNLTAKFRTRTAFAYIESPAVDDAFPMRYVPYDATIVAVRALTDAGTVDFNVECRAKLTPDQAGGDIFAADEQVDAAGEEWSGVGINDTDISADEWLVVTISAVAGASDFWATVEYTID